MLNEQVLGVLEEFLPLEGPDCKLSCSGSVSETLRVSDSGIRVLFLEASPMLWGESERQLPIGDWESVRRERVDGIIQSM